MGVGEPLASGPATPAPGPAAATASVTTVPPGPAVATASVTTVPPGPAVTSWELHHAWGSPAPPQGTYLPLQGPCADLGLPAAGAPVGAVQAGGVQVNVTARCDAHHPDAVKLTLGPVPWNGRVYTGTINVAAPPAATTVTTTPAGSTATTAAPSDAVALSVTATTDWWVVLLILLVGVILGVLAQQWQSIRIKVGLRARTSNIESMVTPAGTGDADTEFARAAAADPAPVFADDAAAVGAAAGLPAQVQSWRIRDLVLAKTDWLRRRMRAASAGDLKKISDQLDDLESIVRGWPEVPKVLKDLRAQLPTLRDLTVYEAKVRAATLGSRGPARLGDVAAITAAATAAIAFAADWTSAQATIDLMRAGVARLEGLPQKSPEDQRLIDAFDNLCSVLAGAVTADDARAQRAALDNLAADVERQVDRRTAEIEAALRGNLVPPLAPVGLAPPPAPVPPAAPLPPGAPAPGLADPKQRAALLRLLLLIGDYSVIGLIGVAAVIAGMEAIYVGKAYGGSWDVLATATWGLLAGAIAGPLGSTLSGAFQSLHLLDVAPLDPDPSPPAAAH